MALLHDYVRKCRRSLIEQQKIAEVLGQTLGSLVVQAEDISRGRMKSPPPTLDPKYLDRAVPLPSALTHDRLEAALNSTLVFLDQLGLNPAAGDIQPNVYSAAVAQRAISAMPSRSAAVRASCSRCRATVAGVACGHSPVLARGHEQQSNRCARVDCLG